MLNYAFLLGLPRSKNFNFLDRGILYLVLSILLAGFF